MSRPREVDFEGHVERIADTLAFFAVANHAAN
jgi:hypothetical protein